MAEYTGWRNFWWLNVALHSATFLMLLFGFPETKWHRAHPGEMKTAAALSGPSFEEKVEPTMGSGPDKPSAIQETADFSHTATSQRDPFLGRGTPSKQQFKLFQPNEHPFKSIAIDLWTPWKLFAFPIVEFASFVVSWSASSFLTLNLTQSEAFAAPPYHFSSATIGLFNFAILIGAMIGLLTAGPLSDWVSMRATRRNKGIREPEMRLPSMIPYVLVMMLGNFIVAFGYQHVWNWKVVHPSSMLRETLTRTPLRTGHRNHRLHLRRHPSSRPPFHRQHLRRRLVQARQRQHLRFHHCQQEHLGLRLLQVHHALDHPFRLRSAHHDEHEFDHAVVSLRIPVLVEREDVQEVESG
jgi:hypothetical protein